MRALYVHCSKGAQFTSVNVRHSMGGNAVTIPEWTSIFHGASNVHTRIFTMPNCEKVAVCWPGNHLSQPVSSTILERTGRHWHGDLIVFRVIASSGLYRGMTSNVDGDFAWDAVRFFVAEFEFYPGYDIVSDMRRICRVREDEDNTPDGQHKLNGNTHHIGKKVTPCVSRLATAGPKGRYGVHSQVKTGEIACREGHDNDVHRSASATARPLPICKVRYRSDHTYQFKASAASMDVWQYIVDRSTDGGNE
ncbi:hypothetical protein PENSPDRAFT_671592 [Peniophora sp. CONT]|nr:hypothetical protein PENSPDRAFT_671592 [Peniophora sp. CONT]